MPLTIQDSFRTVSESYLNMLLKLDYTECYIQTNKHILLRHIYPFIEEKAICKINKSDISSIEMYLNECGFSPTYKHNILGLVKRIFSYAEQNYLIKENPCINIDCSFDHSLKLRMFTSEENQLLLNSFKEIPLGELFSFLFVSGIKLCEGLALKKENYNNQSGELLIDSRFPMTAFDDGNEKIIKHPRTIILPEAARIYLETAASHHPNSNYFFRSPTGGNITRSMLNNSTIRARKISGVHDFKISYMKTNFLLHCMNAGVNDVALEKYLGYVCKTTFFQIRHIPFAHCFHKKHHLN